MLGPKYKARVPIHFRTRAGKKPFLDSVRGTAKLVKQTELT